MSMPNSESVAIALEYSSIIPNPSLFPPCLVAGGLFLDPIVPPSFVRCLSFSSFPNSVVRRTARGATVIKGTPIVFSSLSLKDSTCPVPENDADAGNEAAHNHKEKVHFMTRRRGAMNSTKHLWAGAVAAMVARTVVAPLERLKLEYIVRGEQKNILELIKTIAQTQGLRGFWKGNLVNILRTAPFKAINFCAYDIYRKQLSKIHLVEGMTHVERFIAGAAAGITATVLCLPLDTIRTRIVAHGGENLGGVVGAFRFMIKTEGFFSLYRGLLPSIISVAPSSAVFYGVYDALKSAFLHSPEGGKRLQKMKLQGQDSAALNQLELGPLRTLVYGAISGACAEVSTYPFEVVRRQLQLQSQATKLSTVATFVKILEEGGIPGLYAGLLPSLLQDDSNNRSMSE